MASDPREDGLVAIQQMLLTKPWCEYSSANLAKRDLNRVLRALRSNKPFQQAFQTRFPNHSHQLWQLSTKESELLTALAKKHDPYPVEVEWHTGTACGNSCYYCSTNPKTLIPPQKHADWQSPSSERDRFIEDMFDLLSDHGAHTLQISGGAEPTGKGITLDIAEFASRVGMSVRMNTSAVEMGSIHETSKGVCRGHKAAIRYAKHFSQIAISVEAHKAATYARIKRCSSDTFDRVVNNIKRLQIARQDLSSCLRIDIVVLVLRQNIEILPEICQFFLDMGVDTIRLRRLKNEAIGRQSEFASNENLAHIVQELCCDSRIDYNREDFLLDYAEIVNNAGAECWASKRRVIIDPYGRVYTCPYFSTASTPEEYEIGILTFRESFSEFWRSTRRRRNAMPRHMCKRCYFADRMTNRYMNKLLNDYEDGVPFSAQPFVDTP